MPVMNMLPGGSTLQIPLDAPTSLAATAGNAQVELTWTDPADKYATPEGEVSETGDQLVSEWSHTVLVRKTGSQPAGPDDGTVVVSSSVRNQYQTTPYTDTGLTNDTLYYYGVFAYNKDGVASAGAFTSATPKAGTPLSELTEGTLIKINENGSPVEFYLAKHNYEPGLNGEGRELVVRKDVVQNGAWKVGPQNTDTYASSDIDSWYNTTYKGYFAPAVQEAMGSTMFNYTPGRNNYQVTTLSRSVFAMAGGELGRSTSGYNAEGSALPIASMLRVAYLNGSPNSQWTRSPYKFNEAHNIVMRLTSNGSANSQTTGNLEGYRPCFCLPATARVNSTLDLMEESLST